MSSSKEEKSGGSLSLQTLLISSLSAAAAAVIVPMIWERGSLIATAITPIIVALVSEGLNRPAKAITAVAPHVTRRSATGAAVRTPQPTGVGARGDGPERVPPREDDPYGLYADEQRPRRRRGLKLAIITGLLAALIGGAVVTASELAVFGHQIGNAKRSTGLLGGRSNRSSTPTPTSTATATPTGSATGTPTKTPTPTPTGSATPTPSVSATPSVTPSATATPPAAPTQAAPTATAAP